MTLGDVEYGPVDYGECGRCRHELRTLLIDKQIRLCTRCLVDGMRKIIQEIEYDEIMEWEQRQEDERIGRRPLDPRDREPWLG